MLAKKIRNININMRTTAQEKILLQEAAELAGFSNLTNFIMTAARQEANRILSDAHTVYVSLKDWESINRMISETLEPNKELKKLLSGGEE